MSGTGESPATKRARRALYEARLRAGRIQEDAEVRSTSTISRWESGKYEPSWAALDAYAHELGQTITLWFGPEPKEAAPPDWAKRLLEGLFALEAKAEISDEELAEAQARVAAFVAVTRQRRHPPTSGGDGGAVSA